MHSCYSLKLRTRLGHSLFDLHTWSMAILDRWSDVHMFNDLKPVITSPFIFKSSAITYPSIILISQHYQWYLCDTLEGWQTEILMTNKWFPVHKISWTNILLWLMGYCFVINSVIKWKIGLKRIIFCVWLFSVPRFHWLILIKTLDTFLSDIGNYFVYWFPFRLFECVWRESKVINLLQNFMIDVGDSCRIKIACKIMWI